jgi:hypothetical protein
MNFQQQLLDHLDASAEARVVHDQGKGQNALVVLRQFHGSKYHAIDTDERGAFYPHTWPKSTAKYIVEFLKSIK